VGVAGSMFVNGQTTKQGPKLRWKGWVAVCKHARDAELRRQVSLGHVLKVLRSR
jgi:hypothetical protein